MIRLFAALVPPFEIAEALGRLQQGLPGARWRPPESLHVTLRFFGEIKETTAEDLDGELAQVRGAPFDLALEGVGAFGEGERLSAVWAGVRANPELGQLARHCERAARRAGLAAETRVFHPHLTLAYLDRGAAPEAVAAWIQTHNLLSAPPFRVSAFGLYSSHLGAHVSSYQLERSYALRG